jgi:hypothetical protein
MSQRYDHVVIEAIKGYDYFSTNPKIVEKENTV